MDVVALFIKRGESLFREGYFKIEKSPRDDMKSRDREKISL
jgi:hypothetical protein